jgi:hypothetical protein
VSEPETITYQGQSYRLRDEAFWHVSAANALIYHNAFIAKGLVHSISFTSEMAGLKDVVSPYSFRARFDDKEQLWERLRKETAAERPSRIGAFFLVETEDRAREIADRWFVGEQRRIIKTRVIEGSALFRADAHWLDSQTADWERSARRYWGEEQSEAPAPEILVHGAVYFPDWQEPPFGLFAGLLPKST